MNRSLEQSLLSLLPTQNAALPPALVELAGSLLAQSRHRASTLKAEEEVARTYACAHLACDRLKISLNLPPIDPRPPIPPRIYSRLYNHLDNILPSSSLGGRPRPGHHQQQQQPGTPRRLPSRATPTKEASLARFRTPTGAKTATPTRTARAARDSAAAAETGTLPPWVQPTVRAAARALDKPRVGPTVMAGMAAIATPPPHGRRAGAGAAWAASHLTALLAALFFYVLTQTLAAEGIDVDEEGFERLREQVLLALRRARREVVVKRAPEEDEAEAWAGWVDVDSRAVDDAVVEVLDRGWLQEGDWYAAIGDVVASRAAIDDEDTDMAEEAGAAQAPIVRIMRADTMLQDKYEYLSERKREEFRVWKTKMLARLDELDAQAAEGRMEVDG